MPPKIDDLVNGKFRLVRALGEGGMGSVFEATHEGLGTRVAIKFLHAELMRRNEVLQRFVQEARLVAKVKSPHVVGVQDVEQTPDGTPFIVLEFLEGRTLQRMINDLHKQGRRIDRAEALDLAVQMLEGAQAAHAAGVVHRDLKPDNVMIVTGPQGEPFVKLLDFGIAKVKPVGRPGMTRPGVVMGTPEYMAPEQAFSSDSVDARADVFALGVMIFEMLADGRPLAGDDPQVLAAAHLSGDVPKLGTIVTDLPPGLAEIVDHAMAARPPDRFNSAGEFLAALRPFALGYGPPRTSPSAGQAFASTDYAPAQGAASPSRQPIGKGQTTPLARFEPSPSTQPAEDVRPKPYPNLLEPTVGGSNPGLITGDRAYGVDPPNLASPTTNGGMSAPIGPANPSAQGVTLTPHARRGLGMMWIALLVTLGLLVAVAVLLVVLWPRQEEEHPHHPVPTRPQPHRPQPRHR